MHTNANSNNGNKVFWVRSGPAVRAWTNILTAPAALRDVVLRLNSKVELAEVIEDLITVEQD